MLLILGFSFGVTPNPSLSMSNQHRINLKPHLGVFWASLCVYLEAGTHLVPVIVQGDGPLWMVPAVGTHTNDRHLK